MIDFVLLILKFYNMTNAKKEKENICVYCLPQWWVEFEFDLIVYKQIQSFFLSCLQKLAKSFSKIL